MDITIIVNAKYKVEMNNIFLITLLLMCSTYIGDAIPTNMRHVGR